MTACKTHCYPFIILTILQSHPSSYVPYLLSLFKMSNTSIRTSVEQNKKEMGLFIYSFWRVKRENRWEGHKSNPVSRRPLPSPVLGSVNDGQEGWTINSLQKFDFKHVDVSEPVLIDPQVPKQTGKPDSLDPPSEELQTQLRDKETKKRPGQRTSGDRRRQTIRTEYPLVSVQWITRLSDWKPRRERIFCYFCFHSRIHSWRKTLSKVDS